MNMASIPEILAPAGDRECLAAALNAGADAVYAGVAGFNMRAGAEPLDMDAIAAMTASAHDAGARLHLALNVIVFDDELDATARILDAASEAGVDAVIAWDMAVVSMAAARGLDVHLSTQASAANSETVAFYGRQGVTRVVMARELTLERLAATVSRCRRNGSAMVFECFVHGAMCVAVSGRCLASGILRGRSANRGDCLQPCRRTYRVVDERNADELLVEGRTVFSARDLCTIDIVDRLMAAGAGAFKIEGRMRDARYVATTVECYREARDAVIDGVYDDALIARLRARLDGVFHRGFSHGFYLGEPADGFSDSEGNMATEVRRYAGRVLNHYPRVSAADVLLEARGMALGDRVLITGPTTGAVEFTVSSLRSADDVRTGDVRAGEVAGLAVPERVRENDRVYVIERREGGKGKITGSRDDERTG